MRKAITFISLALILIVVLVITTLTTENEIDQVGAVMVSLMFFISFQICDLQDKQK